MRKNKILRLTLAPMMLLLASLACTLGSITVDCTVTDLIDSIDQANSSVLCAGFELA